MPVLGLVFRYSIHHREWRITLLPPQASENSAVRVTGFGGVGQGGKEGSAKDQMLETGSPICERTGIVTRNVLDFPGGLRSR